MSFFVVSRKFFIKALGIFLFLFFILPTNIFAEIDLKEREAQLQKELQKIEEEQKVLQENLDKQKGQTATIQRDVTVLTNQIKQAELNIKKKKLEIESLSKEIDKKDQTVLELNDKTERSKQALAELIRKTNEKDNYSLTEILLASENLSDFFGDLDSYNVLQKQLEQLFQDIRVTKGETEKERLTLEQKQKLELDKKKEIENNKATVAVKKSEKDTLLNASKQTEAGYQQILREKQAKAASIRAALFQLRDTQGISFGDALKYAQLASKNTGVRPAFILAILKQESNIGQNVGSCVITDLDNGQTKSLNSGNVFANGIHPVRDLPILKIILDNLKRNPLDTKVSCPQSVGYGGAMGPSQFIPSTWQNYIPRLQQIFGIYPDPWYPEHAITATALFLKDLGAATGGYSAEFEASARYYAGGNWEIYGKGYANSVLSYATEFQNQIDFLKDADN